MVLHGDIQYGSDIARDFLLLEETAYHKSLTLIGPHSGGIPGLYHGPAWIYLNLPAFILSRGNPVAVGFFWILLSILSVFFVYLITKNLFGKKVSLLTALLYSVYPIIYAKGLTNPFGAVMLFPLFFYFFYQYTKSLRVLNLFFALFFLGLLTQFQIAFGGPIIFLTIIYIVPFIIKRRKFFHLSTFLILAILLSTFILFDFRHNFLQLNSFFKYLTGVENFGKMNIINLIFSRLKGILFEGFYMFNKIPWWLSLPMIFYLISQIIKSPRIKKDQYKIFTLFAFFYYGYWLITFLYRGIVFYYYYWPFLPISIMLFCATILFIDKRIFYSIFLIIFIFNFASGIKTVFHDSSKYVAKDIDSWKFNYMISQSVFRDGEKKFGYYVFTPDLLGYVVRYAMLYTKSKYPTVNATPYIKQKITYLFVSPPFEDRLFNNGIWWKSNQVKIKSKPIKVITYENGMLIEKYELTDDEVKDISDPNLINSLIFR